LPVVGAWALFSLIAVPILAKKFVDRPKQCLALSFLYSLGILLYAALYGDPSLMWCSAWLCFVGLAGVLVYVGMSDPKRLRAYEWEKLLPILFGAVFVFAVRIYGNIVWYYGGGKPVPVIMTIATKTPVSDSNSVPVLLVEETEHGYFVLTLKDRETAYYLRRDLVTAIHFVKDEQSLR
jgi:hypothetical protein